MRLQGSEEGVDPFEKPIVDNSLVLVCLDLVLALESLLMDLILFGSNERAFVDVRVDFDVGIVAQLKSILILSALRFSLVGWRTLK